MSRISPVQRGMPVIEEGTNFLSSMFLKWLNFIVERLNRAVVTDAKGNVAYGNATIPDDVDPEHFHIFYPNGSARVIDRDGSVYDTSNAYVRNDAGVARWQYLGTGKAGLFITVSNLNQKTSKLDAIDNGGPLGTGFNIPWVLIVDIDTIGNINIKTGSTYTATL